MKRLIVPVLGAAVLAIASTSFACPGKRLGFEDLDADGNGAITAEEFAAGAQARANEKFARIDTNSDGVVTQEEMEAAKAAFRERHSHRKRGESAL